MPFSTYSLVVVNPPVLADFRGNPGNYHLWFKNLSNTAFSGTVKVTAPAPLAVAAARGRDDPTTEGVSPCPFGGWTANEQLDAIAEMSAELTVGGRTLQLRRAVIPAMPNGGFESNAAGDLKPDWWMCRKAETWDGWAYERMHLAEDAHGGKFCLQLDAPQSEEKSIFASPVHSVAKPNTRYRISIWIKAASKDGVYAELLGQCLGKGKTGPEWRQFTTEVTTGEAVCGICPRLCNSSTALGVLR